MIDLSPFLWSFGRRVRGTRLVLEGRAPLWRIGSIGLAALGRGGGRCHTIRSSSIGFLCSFRHQKRAGGAGLGAGMLESESRRLFGAVDCPARLGVRWGANKGTVGLAPHPPDTLAGGTRVGARNWTRLGGRSQWHTSARGGFVEVGWGGVGEGLVLDGGEVR